MVSAHATIQIVTELAGRLPGILVRGCELGKSEARLCLLSSGSAAIESIQWLAGAANVSVEPCLRRPASDAVVEQCLSARFTPRAGLKFGELQMLGIHIVWRLHKLKLMTAAEANPILKGWRAAEVGD